MWISQKLLQVVTGCYKFLNSSVTGSNPWGSKARAIVLQELQEK